MRAARATQAAARSAKWMQNQPSAQIVRRPSDGAASRAPSDRAVGGRRRRRHRRGVRPQARQARAARQRGSRSRAVRARPAAGRNSARTPRSAAPTREELAVEAEQPLHLEEAVGAARARSAAPAPRRAALASLRSRSPNALKLSEMRSMPRPPAHANVSQSRNSISPFGVWCRRRIAESERSPVAGAGTKWMKPAGAAYRRQPIANTADRRARARTGRPAPSRTRAPAGPAATSCDTRWRLDGSCSSVSSSRAGRSRCGRPSAAGDRLPHLADRRPSSENVRGSTTASSPM